MSNFSNPSRLGQSNGAGDARALFLKKWAGEVFTAWYANNEYAGQITERTISKGKASQFPRIGTAAGGYHTAGTEIDPGAISQAEVVLSLDNNLYSSVFVDDLDEAMTHYEYRSAYTNALAERLMQTKDDIIGRLSVIAARTATPTITGEDAGSTGTVTAGLRDASAATDAGILAGLMFTARETARGKNTPVDGWCFNVGLAQWYLLLNSDLKIINRDYGGQGSAAGGTGLMLDGVPIKANRSFPTGNLTTLDAAETGNNDYSVNCTDTIATLHHPGAIGFLNLKGMRMDTEWMLRNLGWQTVAWAPTGAGVLRPELAVEITKGVTT